MALRFGVAGFSVFGSVAMNVSILRVIVILVLLLNFKVYVYEDASYCCRGSFSSLPCCFCATMLTMLLMLILINIALCVVFLVLLCGRQCHYCCS